MDVPHNFKPLIFKILSTSFVKLLLFSSFQDVMIIKIGNHRVITQPKEETILFDPESLNNPNLLHFP